MKDIKVIHRPVRILSDTHVLDREFRAARWIYHRLLDFELEHQAMLDAAFPRLTRVGKLLGRLKRRDRWRERVTGGWAPKERPELRKALEELRVELRKERNADPRWKELLGWPRDKVGEKRVRRQKDESDEKFEERRAKAYRSRREQHAINVYAQRRCHWDAYNAQKKFVDQAVKTVLKVRREGRSARLRRPKWSDPGQIQVMPRSFEWDRQSLTMHVRLHQGWATFKLRQNTGGVKGLMDEWPEDASIRVVELCRERVGNGWKYSVSVTIAGTWTSKIQSGKGVVGIDTGHRQYSDGRIRAWVWYGDDGRRGEVVLPAKCRQHLLQAQAIQEAVDKTFLKMNTGFKNRHLYRRHLLSLGVRTEEQASWLAWETTRERSMRSHRKKARNIRTEIYTQAVRDLRRHYDRMGIDVVGKSVQRLQIDEMTRHNIRQNRDLVSAYSVKVLCERYGIKDMAATARDSTAECPGCHELRETSKDLTIWCPSCDLRCDQDFGAAYIMMCRAADTPREPLPKGAEEQAA